MRCSSSSSPSRSCSSIVSRCVMLGAERRDAGAGRLNAQRPLRSRHRLRAWASSLASTIRPVFGVGARPGASASAAPWVAPFGGTSRAAFIRPFPQRRRRGSTRRARASARSRLRLHEFDLCSRVARRKRPCCLYLLGVPRLHLGAATPSPALAGGCVVRLTNNRP